MLAGSNNVCTAGPFKTNKKSSVAGVGKFVGANVTSAVTGLRISLLLQPLQNELVCYVQEFGLHLANLLNYNLFLQNICANIRLPSEKSIMSESGY